MKQKVIHGSVCNLGNYKRLQFARAKLATIKENKLWLRHEKNNRNRHSGIATIPRIYDHLKEELEELLMAIQNDDVENAWEELADIINCAEIIGCALMFDLADAEVGK
jgi:hypothetical protein